MSAPEVHLPGTPAQKAAEEEADVEMSGATAEEPAVIDDEDDAAEEVDPEDTALEPIKKPTFLEYAEILSLEASRNHQADRNLSSLATSNHQSSNSTSDQATRPSN